MLETTAKVDRSMDDVEEDRVDVIRGFAHDAILDGRHLGNAVAQIARHRWRVIRSGPQRNTNPFTVCLERVEAVATDERHRVRQLVVIAGTIHSVRWTFQR